MASQKVINIVDFQTDFKNYLDKYFKTPIITESKETNIPEIYENLNKLLANLVCVKEMYCVKHAEVIELSRKLYDTMKLNEDAKPSQTIEKQVQAKTKQSLVIGKNKTENDEKDENNENDESENDESENESNDEISEVSTKETKPEEVKKVDKKETKTEEVKKADKKETKTEEVKKADKKETKEVKSEEEAEERLFTGYGLFSMILPSTLDISYPNKIRSYGEEKEEVVIKKGVMIRGTLDASVLGNKSNSLVHIIMKDYSNMHSCDFVSHYQFITDHWLFHRGFSVGISDCMAIPFNTPIEKRAKKLNKKQLRKIKQIICCCICWEV
jgi:hypothetical protein